MGLGLWVAGVFVVGTFIRGVAVVGFFVVGVGVRVSNLIDTEDRTCDGVGVVGSPPGISSSGIKSLSIGALLSADELSTVDGLGPSVSNELLSEPCAVPEAAIAVELSYSVEPTAVPEAVNAVELSSSVKLAALLEAAIAVELSSSVELVVAGKESDSESSD